MVDIVYDINDSPRAISLDTSELFDKSYRDPNRSAIDNFSEKARDLNTIVPEPSARPTRPLPSLILLGYVSAVESYFRDIIRRLILSDPYSREACEGRTLTYGAALSHGQEKLPEALLESTSFASDKNVINAFREFVGIKGEPSGEVKMALGQFSEVCQLRHCVVHRFGHLGSNNAIKLGLAEHKACLEKPLVLDFDALQDIFLVCTNAVRVSNTYLFHKVIERAAANDLWTWDLRRDKKKFLEYYKAFVYESSSTRKSYRDAYNAFRVKQKRGGSRRPPS